MKIKHRYRRDKIYHELGEAPSSMIMSHMFISLSLVPPYVREIRVGTRLSCGLTDSTLLGISIGDGISQPARVVRVIYHHEIRPRVAVQVAYQPHLQPDRSRSRLRTKADERPRGGCPKGVHR